MYTLRHLSLPRPILIVVQDLIHPLPRDVILLGKVRYRHTLGIGIANECVSAFLLASRTGPSDTGESGRGTPQ